MECADPGPASRVRQRQELELVGRPSDSPRAPYLDTLPTTFTTPLFWSEAELEELSGTQCLDCLGKDEIAEKFESGIKPFLAAHESMFPEDCRSYEMFLRMVSLSH